VRCSEIVRLQFPPTPGAGRRGTHADRGAPAGGGSQTQTRHRHAPSISAGPRTETFGARGVISPAPPFLAPTTATLCRIIRNSEPVVLLVLLFTCLQQGRIGFRKDQRRSATNLAIAFLSLSASSASDQCLCAAAGRSAPWSPSPPRLHSIWHSP